MLRCFLLSSVLTGKDKNARYAECQHGKANDGEHPVAVRASLREIKASRIDDCERCKGIGGAVVSGHVDLVAVYGCRSSQQFVGKLFLRHIVIQSGINILVSGIVLDKEACVKYREKYYSDWLS